MDNERKLFLTTSFIFNGINDINLIKLISLEEISFLIASCVHLKKEKEFNDINFEAKQDFFKSVLIERIKECEQLFLIRDSLTKYPFIWIDNSCWVYSKLEFAEATVDHYKGSYNLEVEIIDKKKIESFLNVNYSFLGLEKITINLGEYPSEVRLDELVKLPDYSNTPKINIPITNPKLQCAALKFFQQLGSPCQYENKNSVLRSLEDEMLYEVIKGKYLVPVRKKTLTKTEEGVLTLEKDSTIDFGVIVNVNNEYWIPAFTDWIEFTKKYSTDEWQGFIMSYDDLLALNYSNGIVINPFGFNLTINPENIKFIEEFKKWILERENKNNA